VALKVAIVGLSNSSHHLAPWGDKSWQLWGLAWDSDWIHFHRTFEMHDLSELKAGYVESLEHRTGLYTQWADGFIPNSKQYPFDAVAESVGDYWCSSIAYMMALAIHEGAEEIGIYGVDMKADDEYGYQKPNMEYLVGLARGKGIKVHIPACSPLCKFVSVPDVQYAGRYGRLP